MKKIRFTVQFYKKRCLSALFFILLLTGQAFPQRIDRIGITGEPGLSAINIHLTDSSLITFQESRPLFSFNIDNQTFTSDNTGAGLEGGEYFQDFNSLTVRTIEGTHVSGSWTARLVFENRGTDTISVSNVVPFGTTGTSACITGYGPWDLARAYLFRPGFRQVRVILPDNAWELGYSSFTTGTFSVCGLARRIQTEGGQRMRYETILPPGASVTYAMYADIFTGDWQAGLRLMFRDKYLFDLNEFDNRLFERSDLQWIKSSYIIVLQMAWDREFYDRSTGKYTYADELRRWNEQFDHIDVFGIWPTWPRLGLDPRNQWDMYRDLPGGTDQLRTFARLSRQYNTRFFIAYNPWDNSTRKEDHLKGMAKLISDTEADGVVLDTRGSSSYELQAAADSVRKGVVMFSEGMAVTRDMPGIIAGRVHNAIYYSPELNLNKLIKPDFSIFRVCDVGEDNNHREIAIAFFNGYGTELNLFRPGGRDEGYRQDLQFLARTTFILRQNNDAFLDHDWTPLIQTTADRAYVNKWSAGEKTIYTVLNMRPEGIDARLFKEDESDGTHFISLWNHENIKPVSEAGGYYIPVKAPGWDDSFTGTRHEGSLDCIAKLPELIKAEIRGDSLAIGKPEGGRLLLWKGDPSFQTPEYDLRFSRDTVISLKSTLGYYEGKIVLQYLVDDMLCDENIQKVSAGKPWLVSRLDRTTAAREIPSDMVLIPKAVISYKLSTSEDFIPYPHKDELVVASVDSFLLDRFPVTNSQFYDFLVSSGYVPSDTANFLRHWDSGMFRQGQEKYPVVCIGYEDMQAYAKWAGKRLPTEAEWQLAAQGTDGRRWPWGNDFRGTWCNNAFERPTPVDAFSKGASPYGVIDLVGNIWQMTNDKYFNGTNYFTIIRGGSYYKPDSSWWYIQGGPQPLDRTQILLMVSPGFDRSATVGFRCAKDIDPDSIIIR